MDKRFFANNSEDEISTLQTEPLYNELLNKRWPFSLFYQLKFNEIAGGLEAIFTSNTPTANGGRITPPDLPQRPSSSISNSGSSNNNTFLTEAMHNTSKFTILLWKPPVPPPLIARFWRLTIQLWLRLAAHIRQRIEAVLSPDASERPVDEQIATICQLLNVPVAAERCITEIVNSSAKELLPSVASVSQLTETLQLQSALIDPCIPQLTDRLCQTVIKQCADYFKHLKTIPSQYRRTNRPVGLTNSIFPTFHLINR
jgi:hypothetical protein